MRVYLLVVPFPGRGKPFWEWGFARTPGEAYVRALSLLQGNGGVESYELCAEPAAYREVWEHAELRGAPTAGELYRARVYWGPSGPYAQTFLVEVEDAGGSAH